MTAHGLSQRRAYGPFDMDRTSFRYPSTAPDDAGLRTRKRALAAELLRFGYRRLRWLQWRVGARKNHKRFRQLYAEVTLKVQRPDTGDAVPSASGLNLALPQGPNQCWLLDFVFDHLATGRRVCVLSVANYFMKKSLAAVPDTPIIEQPSIAEPDRLVERRRKPLSIVSDNGGEITSRPVLQWTMETDIDWHYVTPGKPTQNAFI
ncbi:MAG: hypothetical protein C6Y20_10440 [Tagaea sp. CACIAM 22H2]|nr:hypothetical protein [Tagaea sp. CACIAM 22H2]